jgi:hypothetical protein
MHLDPILFLKKEDWDHKLYDAFLDHGYELYREKYKSVFNSKKEYEYEKSV